jgi:Raf kinase inhibitor-like YbhB/YbcL family protein
MRRLGLLAVLFAACGGGDSPADPDGPAVTDGPGETDGPTTPDGPSGAFVVTSTAFTEGGVIPDLHTCKGLDLSPQFAWTGAPAGTLSFAVVLTDKSFNDFKHSVIYDIPANLTGLPEDVEKAFAPTDVPGAHQTRSFGNGPNGYRGPCPGSVHTYEFAVYALDVATLPGLSMNSTANQGDAAILMHDLAVTRLTGTFDPN